MNNDFNFWDRYGKFIVALALVLSATSITMNLLSRKLENEAVPEQTADSEFWIDKEETHVINVLAAGAAMPCAAEKTDHIFSNLGSLVQNYDVSAVSVHSLVNTNSSEAFMRALLSQGFKMYGLAYPGALEGGKEGIDRSMEYWNNHSVRTSGTHTSTDTSNMIRMAEYNGVTVIYLSYTDILEEELPENENYLVNVYSDEKTPSFVAEAAQMADLVIVSMVWEGEPGALPNARQRSIAEALADAGASIIVGYSDHAVQPACWIDDTLVFYSLGDFYSEEEDDTSRIGALGAVTVTKTEYGDKSRVELTNPKMDLIASISDEDHNDVMLLDKVSEEQMEHSTELYKGYCETLQRMDDSIRIGGLN